MKKLVGIVTMVLFAQIGIAAGAMHKSNRKKPHNWYKQRHEMILGLGTSNYLGDLGGGSGSGRPWLLDMEFAAFRPSATLGYRYNMSQRMAIRSNLFYGRIVGNDAWSTEPTRKYRNLSFESNILQGSMVYEYYIYRPRRIRRTRAAFNPTAITASAHAGLGFFYFNPKSNGVALRPLRTEGQGLAGGAKAYKPYALSIPMGVEASYSFTRNFKLGLDITYYHTFTDYLDDASTSYYDGDLLVAAVGEDALKYADRTNGDNPHWSAPGSPRGSSESNDHFFSVMITASFNITGYLGKRIGTSRFLPRF